MCMSFFIQDTFSAACQRESLLYFQGAFGDVTQMAGK